ncbi:hypothetical protein SERLA73DRAFT_152391 [Serpula lacrymans var. lacrymans S7.3]|uniref:Uncharacterized protein n=1 Tax=Serpula lacrymans var. lacrymans (strain S7.3) TaxID=936435 RepID=F8PWQ3_SERL3|nr:hypothetical protein SERLA73DRAFT_152391 [Serpula lacrymans var. lacrymans S7.3]
MPSLAFSGNLALTVMPSLMFPETRFSTDYHALFDVLREFSGKHPRGVCNLPVWLGTFLALRESILTNFLAPQIKQARGPLQIQHSLASRTLSADVGTIIFPFSYWRRLGRMGLAGRRRVTAIRRGLRNEQMERAKGRRGKGAGVRMGDKACVFGFSFFLQWFRHIVWIVFISTGNVSISPLTSELDKRRKKGSSPCPSQRVVCKLPPSLLIMHHPGDVSYNQVQGTMPQDTACNVTQPQALE